MRRLLPVLSALLLLAPFAPGCSGDSGSSTDSDSATTGDTTTEGGESSSGGEEACIAGDPVTKSGENKMESFGAPCETAADCEALLGTGAVCYPNILGMYETPGGYCSLECELPDDQSLYELDNASCGVGNHCLGVNGIFTACAPECTSDEDCWRDGYVCRVLPAIGAENDPKFCLMPDSCGPDLGS